MNEDEFLEKMVKSASGLKTKNVLNILQRAKLGKPISEGQQKLVDEFLEEADKQNVSEHPTYGYLPKWAKNKVQAAELLDVPHRNNFSKWRRLFEDAPKNRSNGRENLWEWFDFIQRRGLRDGFRTSDEEKAQDKNESEARLSAARAEFMEHRVDVAKRRVIDTEEARQAFNASILGVKTNLSHVGDSLSLSVSLAHDQNKCRDMINEAISDALNEFADAEFHGFSCPLCKQQIDPVAISVVQKAS